MLSKFNHVKLHKLKCFKYRNHSQTFHIFHFQQQKLQEYEFTEEATGEAALPRIPRNDAPDRFWSSVEPYCAEITNDDLKSLEEMLTVGSDDDADYYKVPPLGKHYSLRWAHEDLQAEQKEGKYFVHDS